MSVSILQTAATLPSGEPGHPLTLPELGSYLRKFCDRQEDRDRNERHRLRDEFYRDGGVEHIKKVIGDVFSHPDVIELRKKWAPYARFNNIVKRIVNELSTVYSKPAKREVGGAGAKVYDELLEELQVDEHAQQWNRMFNLHRALLVGFRIRKDEEQHRHPVIDIVTPATWRVVLHPNDNKVVIGHLIQTDFKSIRTTDVRKPSWVLWTAHERVHCDQALMPIEATYIEHGIKDEAGVGVCPYVPVVRSVAVAGFWPGEEGEDLIAAQVAITIANVLLLKETKSATKQPVVQGDGTGMVRNQAADSEVPIEAPDGVVVTTIDTSMDTSLFTGAADHIGEGIANNYGMGAAQMKHQGVQSAEARELMRVPIRELRVEQLALFRLFERRFARAMSAVMKVDDPDRWFAMLGWQMTFAESQTPMTATEELNLHQKARQLGLDNAVDFVKRKNPDLKDDAAAMAKVARNTELNTWLVGEMRELQAMGAGPNTGVNDDQQNAPGGNAAADDHVSRGQAA